jgi:CRP/FNR family transcriptional regulator, cyclic AMP receptor protein
MKLSVPTLSQLSDQPLFAGLPRPAVERFCTYAEDVNFEAGQLIFAEGAPAHRFYLLRGGKVALSARAPGKGHLLVQTLGPGETLGLSWLFPPYLWQFDARPVELVETTALDGPSMRAELESDPVLGYELLKRFTPIILQRLQQTRYRLLDLYSNG